MPHLLWASDIHLDHATDAVVERFCATLRQSEGVPLLVTGDISTAHRLTADLHQLADAADAPLWFVLGNHDHYHGSVGAVRDAAIALAHDRPQIQWLPPAGVVPLDATTALVGVDGWADGRHGNPLTTPVILNDDRLIAEVAAQPDRLGKLAVKRALADADAVRLTTLLDRAAAVATTILVATHIPPFVEALPASGRLSRVEWHPLLVSGATGRAIRHFATTHPEHRVQVLAGHSHTARQVELLPNLRCHVAAARYGAPTIQQITI
jgi:hypothetical protein